MFTVIETPLFTSLWSDYLWLLLIYAKNKNENIPAHVLKAIKEELEQ